MAVEIIKEKKTKKEKKSVPEVNDIFSFLKKDIRLSGNKLKDAKKEQFYSELSILLSSGIDLKSAFDIIVEQQKKESDAKLFHTIKDKIIHGESFSEALKQSGKFSQYEYFSLKIGEESGRIGEILGELNKYYTARIKQKRQLIGMLSYPILVLIVALGAVFFMMSVIVPMFSEVFKRFGGKLPSITSFIINASVFFQKNFFILIVLIIFFISIYLFFRKTLWYKKNSSLLLLKMPLIGNLINTMYLSRFCQSMALLTGAHTPMLRTIDLIKQMLDFYPYEKALTIVENDILHGKTLNESMNKFPVFDKRMIYLTKVAEEVNQLDTIYSKLAQQYTEELEHKISMMSNLLEPLLIIFVGLLVMIILISMYLPLFQLSTSVF